MRFNYQARTKSGKNQTGVIEAASREAALKLLNDNDLYVILLEEEADKPIFEKRIRIFEWVSEKDLVLFSRQLSIMFKSKVPLLEALSTLAFQVSKDHWREKIMNIAKDVEGGSSFSTALEKYPKVFSSFYIAIVKSGEAAGKLSESLDYLAEHLEREYHLKGKIKGAMLYPAMIFVVMFAVMIIAMVWIVPQLTEVLTASGQELPGITLAVIALSGFFVDWWWLVVGGVIAAIFGFIKASQTEKGKKIIDTVLIRTPGVSGFFKVVYISRFAENFSTLIGSGISITRSLEISADIVGNSVYREIILDAKAEVQKGESVSSVFKKHEDAFTPMFNQMLAVGERTGTLNETILNVVDFYSKEVDRAIDGFLKLLEPVLIIILAIGVTGLLGSLLLPMYQMTSF